MKQKLVKYYERRINSFLFLQSGHFSTNDSFSVPYLKETFGTFVLKIKAWGNIAAAIVLQKILDKSGRKWQVVNEKWDFMA